MVWIMRGLIGVALALGLVILIPVFNDWSAARLLVEELDTVLADRRETVDILIVDEILAGQVEPLDSFVEAYSPAISTGW